MKCKNAIFLVCAVKLLASEDLKAVHEWGTFTSVAGEDGAAMAWQTLSGPSDLPCFVHHLDQRNSKLADFGTVRMETPVLYFYPLKPLTISAHVEFPSGRITEWYPQAALAPMGSRSSSIDWQNVQLGAAATFPTLNQPSHYYAARETDASPLSTGQETEKLLFYRGIADFGVDLNAIVHPDGVSLRNQGIETIPEAILFENHSGQIGYTVIRNLREPANVQFSALAGTLDSLRSHLEQQLTEMGLYSKEAHAMVETWRDSWFEEGLRVFYILPRSKVDPAPHLHSAGSIPISPRLCRTNRIALTTNETRGRHRLNNQRLPSTKKIRPLSDGLSSPDDPEQRPTTNVGTVAPIHKRLIYPSPARISKTLMHPINADGPVKTRIVPL